MTRQGLLRLAAVAFFTVTIAFYVILSLPIFLLLRNLGLSDVLTIGSPLIQIYFLACIILVESFVVYRWFRPQRPRLYKLTGTAALLTATITALLISLSTHTERHPATASDIVATRRPEPESAPSNGGDAGVERPDPTAGQAPGEQAARADAALAMRIQDEGARERRPGRGLRYLRRRHDAPPPAPSVDDLISQMATAPMTLTAPPSMQRDAAATITLVLDPSKTLADLMKQFDANQTKGYTVRFADRMQATLTGDGFAITPSGPSIQAVSEKVPTQWNWDIRAIKKGSQSLDVTLDALLMVDGSSTPRTVKTFVQTITVEVTTPQILSDFFKANWQWLWASILVPLAGWTMRRKPPTAQAARPGIPRASVRLGDS